MSSCFSAHDLFYHPDSLRYEQEVAGAVTIEDLTFPSRSGNILHGQIIRTEHDARGLVVFFHGNYSNLRRTGTMYDWLVAEGYDFFHFDYSGYGESTGSPTPENLYFDGLAALDEAWRHRESNEPVIVIGASLGGAVLLRAIVDWPEAEQVFAMVVDGTFPSYRRMGQAALASNPLGWLIQWIAPLTLSDEYAPGPVLGRRPAVPLLYLHSVEDEVVPFRFGQEIFHTTAPPKWFWPVSEAPHTMAFVPEFPENRALLLAFLAALERGEADDFRFPDGT